jgi:hypothetical protein
MNTTITLNPLALRAVMPCAGAKDVRFYLNTVALFKGKAGGVLAVATDGTVMAFCFDPDGTWTGDDSGPVLIRRTNDGNSAATWKNSILADVAAIKPGRYSGPDSLTITTAGSMAACDYAGVQRAHPSAVEYARFPSLAPYASPTFTGEPSAYNPEMLARAMEGPQIAGRSKYPNAVLLQNGDKAATVVPMSFSEGLRYAAVVMPLRRGSAGEDHPALACPVDVKTRDQAWPARTVPGLLWLAGALGVNP